MRGIFHTVLFLPTKDIIYSILVFSQFNFQCNSMCIFSVSRYQALPTISSNQTSESRTDGPTNGKSQVCLVFTCLSVSS